MPRSRRALAMIDCPICTRAMVVDEVISAGGVQQKPVSWRCAADGVVAGPVHPVQVGHLRVGDPYREDRPEKIIKLEMVGAELIVWRQDRRRYSDNHVWFERDRDLVTLGLTREVTRILTWVNAIDLPREGVLEEGDELAAIDSQKTVVTVTAPVELEVRAVNHELVREPMLIRTDPLGRGWLVRAALPDHSWDALLLPDAYESLRRADP